MGEAIGETLPAAVGVAISPLPIVAVVLMLVSRRGRVNGPAFVLGWLAGLAVLGTVVLLVAGGADASDDDGPATWVSVLKMVLGALLVLVGVRGWRKRPRDGAAATPKWMRALDTFTPVRATAIGAALSSLNPKNMLLAVGAAATIAGTGADTGEQAIAYAVFAVIGTLGVGAPVALALALGDRSTAPLMHLKDWLAANNATIMAVLLLLLGVKLFGDGLGGL